MTAHTLFSFIINDFIRLQCLRFLEIREDANTVRVGDLTGGVGGSGVSEPSCAVLFESVCLECLATFLLLVVFEFRVVCVLRVRLG